MRWLVSLRYIIMVAWCDSPTWDISWAYEYKNNKQTLRPGVGFHLGKLYIHIGK